VKKFIWIIIVGFILRLLFAYYHIYWYDEAASLFVAQQPVNQLLLLTAKDNHPPLYFFIIKILLIFSKNILWLRFFSVLCGTLSIIFFYILSRSFFSHHKALLSTLLFAINPLSIYYSAEIRMYAPLMLLCLMLIISALTVSRKYSLQKYLIFCFLSVLIILTHYSGLLLVGSLFLYLLCAKKISKINFVQMIMSFIIFFGSLIPWFVFIQNRTHLPCWCFPPIVGSLTIFLGFGTGNLGLITYKDIFLEGTGWLIFIETFVTVILSVYFIIGSGVCIFKKHLILLIIFYFPLVSLLIIGFSYQIFSPRALIYLLPVYILILTEGLTLQKSMISITTVFILTVVILTLQLTNRFFLIAPQNKKILTKDTYLNMELKKIYYE
jgi:uncharacterized membrane protein